MSLRNGGAPDGYRVGGGGGATPLLPLPLHRHLKVPHTIPHGAQRQAESHTLNFQVFKQHIVFFTTNPFPLSRVFLYLCQAKSLCYEKNEAYIATFPCHNIMPADAATAICAATPGALEIRRLLPQKLFL